MNKNLKIGDKLWFEEYPLRPFTIAMDNETFFIVIHPELERCYKVIKDKIDNINSNKWWSSKQLCFKAKREYYLQMADFYTLDANLSIEEFMKEDILERYNNSEYWDENLIDEFNQLT